MSDGAVSRLWQRIRRRFDAEAGHLHRLFFAQDDGPAMVPDDSYLRVWLSELFLAKDVAWGAERTPAVQASVRMLYGGLRPRTFATLVQPPAASARGVFEDFQLTELMPYRGQSVELEAGLYAIVTKNNLGTAIDIVTSFASLVVPPVSAVLAVIDKVADGIEKVIEANAADPMLCLIGTLAAPGGGVSNELRPGWLAVVRATEAELPRAELHLEGGRLCRNGARLTGFDYLVLRIEGRRERDDWRTPDLDRAIGEAAYAKDLGRTEEYQRLLSDALSKIWLSADLTPPQRRQVAAAVKEELGAAEPGAVAAGEMTVESIVARRGLPSRQEVQHITLRDLLAG
ncbi:MAG TPA: hypothetical protein VKU39_05820 [Streptosporangiaceae bacterium]|nr:hypothetical protein [Streptosporangiaceae bacterium]